ncbi:hypothetical protein L228DRAFT_264926 [Xylona heveae TC161]|uniref:Uncharacterized protein n=1 Tax=Xylona heveae (strain CBS 132557 / TC161) TaxID=1328760 RepID=A0A165JRI4_XYLHT|nr:hypothetical protein L228DRAFT_264926 [Xylona heveae TC161]KZF26545.1 hypothetical protein L228DRAFT_264926 [Xylona heveae TC161]
MPHKHKRRNGDDSSGFDLPPSRMARPLPVGKQAGNSNKGKNKNGNKNKDSSNSAKSDDANSFLSKPITSYHDDTPRAFARMMAWQSSKGNKGSNSNTEPTNIPNKKRKRGGDNNNSTASAANSSSKKDASSASGTTTTTAAAAAMPTIKPGEKLSDFAARVDAALPVSGLKNKGADPLRSMGAKQRQTKTEKRLQKMYAEWREEDQRIKDRLEDEREEAEEREEEQRELYGLPVSGTVGDSTGGEGAGAGQKKKKKKGGHKAGHDDDDDPWAVLKERDQKPRLNDVAQAPPTFTKIPTEKFRVKNGARVNVANVPNAAGSLRRREELGEARQNVLEAYRKMMEQKRGV